MGPPDLPPHREKVPPVANYLAWPVSCDDEDRGHSCAGRGWPHFHRHGNTCASPANAKRLSSRRAGRLSALRVHFFQVIQRFVQHIAGLCVAEDEKAISGAGHGDE